MPQTAQLPDGTKLEFPDGMSQADMAAAIYKNFPQLKPKAESIPDSPSLSPVYAGDEPPVPEAQPKPEPFKPTEAFSDAESMRLLTAPPLPEKAYEQLKEGSLREKGVSIISGEPPTTPKVSPEELQSAFGMSKGSSEWVAALQHATTGLVDFFLTPEGASLGAIGGISAITKPVAAAFTAQMAMDAPQETLKAYEAFKAGDSYKAKQHAANAILATGIVGLGAKAVMTKAATVTAEPVVTPELKALAPKTAEVLEGKSEPVGITPPGTGKLLELIDSAMPRERGTPPPINPDVSTPIPDFQPREVSKKIGTEPFGAGRLPVLGPLIDPRARIRNNIDEAISAYHYERGVGQAVSSALGEEIRGTIDPAFQVDPATSQIKNIGTTTEGQSLNISDVFEALQKDPNAYVLTPEQRTAFNRMEGLFGEMTKLEDKYDLFTDAEGEAIPGKPQRRESYFPRIVVERPPSDVAPTAKGAKVGGKQFFQKERLFESEAEGVAKGYKYEPSIEKRIVTRAERLYKAVADKRLADDPALGAKTRKDVEAEIREAYAEEIGSGSLTEHKLQQIVDSVERKGSVWEQPAFYGKIFDQQTAKTIREAFPLHESTFRQWIVGGNNLLKGLMLSADMGAPFIQGLVTLYRHPVLWAKAVANSYKSLFSKEAFPEYVRQNLEPIREMAQMGSTVGRLQEMLAGLEQGQTLTKIPLGVGKAFEGFGRGFQSFLDVAKIEIWKATREVTPKDQWQARMQSIESELGIGRMESIGVGRKAALTERVFLLASSYYRGAINLVGAAVAEKGVSGSQTRKAMAAYLAGGTATFIGIAKAIGMKDDEIKERLNPTNANYMMWSMQTETGRKFNVGFGGIHRSLIRLMGNTIKTSIHHPENWAKLTSEENPLTRWYRGHAAPLPARAWDAFSGKDFMGNEVGIREIAQGSLPLAAQQAIPKPGQPKPSAVDVGLSFVGLSAYPEKLQEQFGREREATAQKLYQQPYDKLKMAQAARVTREVKAMPEFREQPPETPGRREAAFKADQERLSRLADGLKDENKAKLKSLGLKLPNYDPSFTMNKTSVPLSKDQREKYEKLVISEYNTTIDRLNTNALNNLRPEARQELLSKRLSDAKLRARRKLFNPQSD